MKQFLSIAALLGAFCVAEPAFAFQ